MALLVLVFSLFARQATAQSAGAPLSRQSPPSERLPLEPTTDLRAHFGVDRATRLAQSGDADERLRGLERAASIPLNAATGVLLRALGSSGAARYDSRALLTVARGLAPRTDSLTHSGAPFGTSDGEVARALVDILNAPPMASRSGPGSVFPRVHTVDPSEEAARVELARRTAAIALATSRDPRVIEMLAAVARGGGMGGGSTGESFAVDALVAFPPAARGAVEGVGAMSPAGLRLAMALGDLRALDAVLLAASPSNGTTRAAALEALATMGDRRGIPLARVAMTDSDANVRASAAFALVHLGSPEGVRAVEALLSKEETALAGAQLAEAAADEAVVRALAARIVVSAKAPLRAAAVRALGRAMLPEAMALLEKFAEDPLLESEVGNAIARSPNPAADAAIDRLLAKSSTRRLGARVYEVRAVVRGRRSKPSERVIETMTRSSDARDRAVAVAALVVLRERSVEDSLNDPDRRVRRAVAGAALAWDDAATTSALLRHFSMEEDGETQAALGVGLRDGDPNARISTLSLLEHAEAAGPDAPLAAMALAERDDPSIRKKIDALLASTDPTLRAHVALGLGRSGSPDAVGRLAAAYAYEPIATVRRAVVFGLAKRGNDEAFPARQRTLALASRLDPDRGVRTLAQRALAGLAADESRTTDVREMAWLRTTSPRGEPPEHAAVGTLLRSDGLAVPIAFDDDGYALIPVPPGDSRIVLAPRPGSYNAVLP